MTAVPNRLSDSKLEVVDTEAPRILDLVIQKFYANAPLDAERAGEVSDLHHQLADTLNTIAGKPDRAREVVKTIDKILDGSIVLYSPSRDYLAKVQHGIANNRENAVVTRVEAITSLFCRFSYAHRKTEGLTTKDIQSLSDILLNIAKNPNETHQVVAGLEDIFGGLYLQPEISYPLKYVIAEIVSNDSLPAKSRLDVSAIALQFRRGVLFADVAEQLRKAVTKLVKGDTQPMEIRERAWSISKNLRNHFQLKPSGTPEYPKAKAVLEKDTELRIV